MTTEELLAIAAPLIGDVGQAFYFAPPTLERGKELGLDGFRFYFLGRGGVLGDVEATVVHSAFGYFNPKVVRKIWDSARERSSLSPRDTGRAYLECCHEFGRQRFGEIDGLDAFCEAAAAVDDAADDAGLALYAGITAEPRPQDPPAQAAHLLAVLRELRGSAHLLSVLASGLTPKVAHYLRRPDEFSLFGWSEEERPEATDADRAALDAADALTDRLVWPAFSVLGEHGREAMVAGLRQMQAVAG